MRAVAFSMVVASATLLGGCTPEPVTVYPVAKRVENPAAPGTFDTDVSKESPMQLLALPESQTVIARSGRITDNLARCSPLSVGCEKSCTVMGAGTWECLHTFAGGMRVHSMEGGTYTIAETREGKPLTSYSYATWWRVKVPAVGRVLDVLDELSS